MICLSSTNATLTFRNDIQQAKYPFSTPQINTLISSDAQSLETPLPEQHMYSTQLNPADNCTISTLYTTSNWSPSLLTLQTEFSTWSLTTNMKQQFLTPRPLDSMDEMNTTMEITIHNGFFTASPTIYLYVTLPNSSCSPSVAPSCTSSSLYPGTFFRFDDVFTINETNPTATVQFQFSDAMRTYHQQYPEIFPENILFDIIIPLEEWIVLKQRDVRQIDFTIVQPYRTGFILIQGLGAEGFIEFDQSGDHNLSLLRMNYTHDQLYLSHANSYRSIGFDIISPRTGFINETFPDTMTLIPTSPTNFHFLRKASSETKCSGLPSSSNRTDRWYISWRNGLLDVTREGKSLPKRFSIHCDNVISLLQPNTYFLFIKGHGLRRIISNRDENDQWQQLTDPLLIDYDSVVHAFNPKTASISQYLHWLFIDQPRSTSVVQDSYIFIKIKGDGPTEMDFELSSRNVELPVSTATKSGKTIGIIVGCVVGGVSLIVVIIILICCCCMNKTTPKSKKQVETNQSTSTPTIPSTTDIEQPISTTAATTSTATATSSTTTSTTTQSDYYIVDQPTAPSLDTPSIAPREEVTVPLTITTTSQPLNNNIPIQIDFSQIQNPKNIFGMEIPIFQYKQSRWSKAITSDKVIEMMAANNMINYVDTTRFSIPNPFPNYSKKAKFQDAMLSLYDLSEAQQMALYQQQVQQQQEKQQEEQRQQQQYQQQVYQQQQQYQQEQYQQQQQQQQQGTNNNVNKDNDDLPPPAYEDSY